MITTDENDPNLLIDRGDGQRAAYLVLSEEERSRGLVRPVRVRYTHLACGAITSMGGAIAETYAKDPSFYGATFCIRCGKHFPLVKEDGTRAFNWLDGQGVGT